MEDYFLANNYFMNSKDSYLIILGSGPQQLLAYKTASRLNIQTLAVDFEKNTPAAKIADKFLLASIKDKNDCLKGLEKLNLHYKGIVVPAAEVMPVAAAIAKRFNLVCVDEVTAYNTTNKCARIEILKNADIPVANFEIIETNSLPKHISFPLIIKPSDNSGCRGVRVVETKEEWEKAHQEASSLSSDGRVVVEEIMHGDEISIEGFVLNNQLFLTGFSDRNFIPGFYPYFMEDGSTAPSKHNPEIFQKAIDVFEKAVKAVGIKEGPTKGDLLVTNGEIKVLEITSRFSPLFPMLMPFKEGIDQMEAYIRWACRLSVSPNLLTQKYNKAMAHRFYFHKPGRVIKIEGLDNLDNQQGVKVVVRLRDIKINDVLEAATFTNRIFYLVTIAETREEAIKLANKAIDTVKIESI
jgi:biotin carboxylase